MTEENELPEIGEIVICSVARVLDYGAFVELVEYDNTKGFVHISQVASSWIKNIRNHVREGEVRAAKVLSIDRQKQQIDLSLTKVSPQEQRARIEQWKQLKRGKKLIELFAEKEHVQFDDAWDGTAKPLLEEYDNLQEAFQQIVLHGESAAKGVKPEWLDSFIELVRKSVSVPEKTVEGVLSLHSLDSEGAELVKKALLQGLHGSGGKVNIFYSGSGKYVVRATAPDFKGAEKALGKAADAVVKEMLASGGKAEFKRSE
ncbi:MAG: translation initiation factor IF-2 subunit alpha [Candidatus Diapherotrites archaeon]|nr:translation initiation factor IF-2 subunit alpha [Candidatus Diapherotrites archaeon]